MQAKGTCLVTRHGERKGRHYYMTFLCTGITYIVVATLALAMLHASDFKTS